VESRRGNKYILITNYRGYIHFTPQKSKSPSDYVRSFSSILALYTAHSLPLPPSLICYNETSLECREYFLLQRLPVQFVSPQMHRSNPAEKSVRTSKNHLISTFASTHPDFPDDLWDRLLPHAELTLNVVRPWRPDPSLSAWSGLHHLPMTLPPTPGQLCLSFNSPDHRLSWDPHGDRAYYLGPALTHYRCHRVYIVSTSTERITLTLAHFPLPYFHFTESDLPPPLPTSPTSPVLPPPSTART
jgi:hypothetical protein